MLNVLNDIREGEPKDSDPIPLQLAAAAPEIPRLRGAQRQKNSRLGGQQQHSFQEF